MSHICSYCKKKVKKNDDYILEGTYPGLGRRYEQHFLAETLYSGLGYWGNLYHKTCFFEKMRKEKFENITQRKKVVKKEI